MYSRVQNRIDKHIVIECGHCMVMAVHVRGSKDAMFVLSASEHQDCLHDPAGVAVARRCIKDKREGEAR